MAMQPKKLLIINILDIMRKKTDAEHRLSQADICKILESEYGMTVDRRSVKSNLMNLVDWGYPLSFTETVRINRQGEEELLLTDFYLEREFDDAELRLLIDSLLFSKHIPYNQCKALVEKIEGLSNCYFKSKVKHIRGLPENLPRNPDLFMTIEVLDEAIGAGRQVEFEYHEYGTDKKLHPRTNADGSPRKYLVNPYQMVATNGRYYLIGNLDKYRNVAHYRLDRIKRIRLMEEGVAKPQHCVEGMQNGLDLPTHMAEHIYMFSGKSGMVTFRAKKQIVGDLLDWFGNDVRFLEESEDEVTAAVRVNHQAMEYWAMQYCRYVKLLSPPELVERVGKDLAAAAAKYEM